jgi:Cu-processing system permease protein
MDFGTVFILIQKELRDAFRNRWFLLYTVAFGILSMGLAWFSASGAGSFGVAGFGRTTAGLINLILLIVPLMGLTLGALSLAGERENGTLAYLLAQPISGTELLLGKFVGLALALAAALVIGFGLTGILMVAAGGGGDFGIYFTLLALSLLLALASLSLGLLLSAAVKRASTAVGLALFAWLILVYFGDLGLMGTSIVMKLKVGQLFSLALANPLQVFKIAAVLDLRDNLEVLGPAGLYAFRTYGAALWPLLISLLLVWAVAPFLLATQVFKKRGVL